MYKKQWFMLLAVLLVSSLVLMACGPAGAPEVDEGGEDIEAPVTEEPTDEPAEEEATKGGYLTFVDFADADSLNPILYSDNASAWTLEKLFGQALKEDPFSGEWLPDLVEGYEVSEDGLTYTFTVREGVNWSDGTPVTVKDFIYTYQALLSGKVDSPRLTAVENLAEVTLVDDMTAEFVFKTVNCTALEDLSLGWLPSHLYAADFSDVMTSDLNTEPTVSNGPFLFKEWVKDDHITLVRNPDYWKGAPNLDGVIFKVVPDETIAAQQLKTGEADMAVVSPTYLAEMEMQEHLALYQHFDDGFTYMAFNLGDPENPQPRLDEEGNLVEDHGVHPILGDVLVRQAIVHAIDRQLIIDRVNFGQGAALNSFVLPAVEWAYNDELPGREYDLEKAAALLDEAGWTDADGDGLRECNGCAYAEEGAPLQLNLRTNSGNERRENTGLIVQDELGKLGFEIEFEAMEWNAFLDTLLNQTFDMIIIGWTDMGSDPDGTDLYTSANDLPGAGFNFVSYYNPRVDELMQEALTVPGCSVDERGPMYEELQQILYDDQPYNWLFVPRDTFAYNSKIAGIEPGPWDYYHNIEEWYTK